MVTGAASGIGRSLARLLGTRGFDLVLADTDVDSLAEVAEQLSARAVPTDVADASSMESLAGAAGTCDLLCLNAGVLAQAPVDPWESPPEEWRRVLDINLGGVVNGLRSFVPVMRDRADGSAILITASLAGLITWPGGGPYAASKHAVLAVGEQAAMALADRGINVTVICPALVRTGMSEVGEDPDDTARRALDAVDSGVFAVVPDEWGNAIRARTDALLSGHSPAVPTPG